MNKSIWSEMKQCINVRTALGVFSIGLLVFLSSTETLLRLFPVTSLQPNDYHTIFVQNALCSDTMAPFIPILSVLPFGANYISDIKSKFARFSLIRTNYSTYLINRIFISFLSGGLVIVTGILLAWGASALLFLPIEKVAETPSEATLLLLETSGLLFLNSGLWSVLGMTMSTVMESKYIAYASPFIVYYLLVILYERYFPDTWLLSPKNWLDPEIWPYGLGSATLFFLELTFLCGLVFYIRGRRRLENL